MTVNVSKVVMAQVTMDGFGKLEATVNPNLPDKQKAILCCQCAEMYAHMAAQAMIESDEDGKPKILVPNMGLSL